MPTLIGYALVNTSIRTPLYEAAQFALYQLRQTGMLAAGVRVATNSLLFLAPAHRGRGLMPPLSAQLHRQLAGRYDVLYATVHRQNLRSMCYHQREGYQSVAEESERVCFLQPIIANASLPVLPAGLRLRPDHPTNAPALYVLNQQWTRAARGDNLAEGFLTTLCTVAEYEILCAAGKVAMPRHIKSVAFNVFSVLADDAIMLALQMGRHGSTFGGNALASVVMRAALDVLMNEDLAGIAARLGEVFRARMRQAQARRPDVVGLVRGKGLLNAVQVKPAADGRAAWEFCVALMEHGLLAKPAHDNVVRFVPPLVITEEQLQEACDVIEAVIDSF